MRPVQNLSKIQDQLLLQGLGRWVGQFENRVYEEADPETRRRLRDQLARLRMEQRELEANL